MEKSFIYYNKCVKAHEHMLMLVERGITPMISVERLEKSKVYKECDKWLLSHGFKRVLVVPKKQDVFGIADFFGNLGRYEYYFDFDFDFDLKLSRDVLFIIKMYENAARIERARLNALFYHYLNYFYEKNDISDVEYCIYLTLYNNLKARRDGIVSHFCKKGYYPQRGV